MICQNAVNDNDIKQWQKLVYKLCIKYNCIADEDAVAHGMYGLFKGLLTYNYDEPTANLCTYLTKTITTEIFMYFRMYKKQHLFNLRYLNEPIRNKEGTEEFELQDVIPDKNDDISVKEYLIDYEKAYSTLTERQKEILKLKLLGMSQKEIGLKLNVSQSYISRTLKSVYNILSGKDKQ